MYSLYLLLSGLSALANAGPMGNPSIVTPRYGATHASPALITPAPDVKLRARQETSITSFPYTLTDCVPQQDPDMGSSGAGCTCDNWEGMLPNLATGAVMCDYSVLTASPTLTSASTQAVDTTIVTKLSTLANSGEVEYWLSMPTTANQPDAGPFPMTTLVPVSSSALYSGNKMTIQMASSSSVNVGNMTGTVLYTAISDALMSACTETPPALPTSGMPTATVTACGEVPKITDIIYTDDEGGWFTGGELEISIPWVKYYDMQSLQGMIASIAGAINGSSLNPNSTWTPTAKCSWPVGKFGQECTASDIGNVYPDKMVNIPAAYQALFTQDTAERHDWPVQDMYVSLAFEGGGGDFKCADAALIMDSLATLPLLPGLDFLSFLAIPALGMSITCDVQDHNEPE